jgi:hypothetical protein
MDPFWAYIFSAAHIAKRTSSQGCGPSFHLCHLVSCRRGPAQPKPLGLVVIKQLAACSVAYTSGALTPRTGTADSIGILSIPNPAPAHPDSQSLGSAAGREARRTGTSGQRAPEAARSTRQVCTAAATGWGKKSLNRSMERVRRASHAGSWYTNNGTLRFHNSPLMLLFALVLSCSRRSLLIGHCWCSFTCHH